MPADSNITQKERRAQTQSVGKAISGLTRKALDRRGFVDASIINEWPTIAGELIGKHSLPDRIIFSRDRTRPGSLHLILENGALATEVMHFEPILLERNQSLLWVSRCRAISRSFTDLYQNRNKIKNHRFQNWRRIVALISRKAWEDVGDDELRDALTRLW